MTENVLSYYSPADEKVSPAEDARIGRRIIRIYWMPILVPMALLSLSVLGYPQSFIHLAWIPTYLSDKAAAGPLMVALLPFPLWQPGEPLRLCPGLVPPIAGLFLNGGLVILMLSTPMRYMRTHFHICVSIAWWVCGCALQTGRGF
jgi:hypothetical protein